MSDETRPALGTQAASAAEREIYMIACGQHADAYRAALDRIAELEATVARLTAPVTEEEREAALYYWRDDSASGGLCDALVAVLTAFLERRMKG